MKCPYCESENLVWDYKNGNLVCTSCGSVIDKIYYEDSTSYEESVYFPETLYFDFFSKTKRIKEFKNKTLKGRRNKLQSTVIYNGSLIKETSLNAMKFLENNEKLLLLYDTIDNLPVFHSKSVKYKLAIALYFYDKKEFNRLSGYLNISNKYMKKILSKIKINEKTKIQYILKNKIGKRTNNSFYNI
ncbi:TFIIB-type zinc ribbon-containing protein [Sulfurisphaera ohwakuensis]|uniref:TFIIB-type zinc ribbon-containing protein n=1 Tax=Sulfurisphaera ohwakuensis TaxID=69656 RepID=UPI0036F27AF0